MSHTLVIGTEKGLATLTPASVDTPSFAGGQVNLLLAALHVCCVRVVASDRHVE